MATTLTIKNISTLSQFSKFIESSLVASAENTLWFRGIGNSNFGLSPSLHRHPLIKTPAEVLDLETKIIQRFNQRAVPFLHTSLDRKNDWEVLFFMQHYRIPTRLLDWSENPFISLYFALTSAQFDVIGKKKVYKYDAALWILDPVIWNKESLKAFSYNDGILSIEDSFVNSYKPRSPFVSIAQKPVAIFGTHNSPRIVSQRGVFTVFGKEIQPMEKTYVSDTFPQDCLMKLIFPKTKIDSLLNSLISIGITDSVVYPDLEGLSKEMMRFFKFDI
jgi:hypothetical protein